MLRAKVCFKFHPHKDYLKYGQKITPSTQNLNSMNHLLFSTLQPPKLLLIPSGNQRGLLENPPFGFWMILPAINLYIYGIFMDFHGFSSVTFEFFITGREPFSSQCRAWRRNTED